LGVSVYKASKLKASGFIEPLLLPIDVYTRKWDMLTDNSLMHQIENGKNNLLFVCCLALNKRQEYLLEAFVHYLTRETNYE
jgi:hypothetical protein